jgi:peptide/nickel transport system substrate-binding protein
MQRGIRRRLDHVRFGRSELENHVIDEYFAGHIDRRSFLRRAAVLGLAPAMAGFLAACGSDSSDEASTTTAGSGGGTTAAGKVGGILKVGMTPPNGPIDPVATNNLGRLQVISQVGEYLAFSEPDLTLTPVLAESWTPSADATEWTFKLRKGVKFHNGAEMKAADVVATFERLTDPANKSNALSAFKGVLSKGNTTAVDDYTVKFKADAPNGNFPYLVSADNYNAIILPADYAGDFETAMIGTGPWKLEKYTPDVSLSLVRNTDYWGDKTLLDKLEITFYKDDAALASALQAGTVDVAHAISANGASALESAGFVPVSTSGTSHRQVHMRSDKGPFADKRTRQAMALLLDRPAIISGLLLGQADLGNDSPFAPAFPSTDTSVAQRAKDVAKAKQLLEATGQASGFKVTLTGIKLNEIPDYAVIIQNAAKEANITLDLSITDTYYDNDWLNSDMGITDYGHRGVPNVYLSATLKSDGPWQAAHYSNPTMDKHITDYIAATDLQVQKGLAKQIQELCLEDTPIIQAAFFKAVSWTKKGVTGVDITGMGHIKLAKAALA